MHPGYIFSKMRVSACPVQNIIAKGSSTLTLAAKFRKEGGGGKSISRRATEKKSQRRRLNLQSGIAGAIG